MLLQTITKLACCILLVAVTGCSTAPTKNDPFERFNRGVFSFNKDIDNAVLKPVAATYKVITPQPIDEGITNFFSNIQDVGVVLNDLLQLKFKQAASDTGRVLVNSTVGLLGFIDVASRMDLKKHNEDFGQTLGYWGMTPGPYLVLPFFGPSNLRDAIGTGVDTLTDPRHYVTDVGMRNFFLATNVVRAVDKRADLLGAERVADQAALDPYVYYREAYLQHRQHLVHDGEPPEDEEDEEDLFDEDEKPSVK